MTYQEFVSGPAARQRYWARSHLGCGRMRRAEPNDGHRALARLDPDLLITQNVDGLHEAAGLASAGRAARPDRRRRLPRLPRVRRAGHGCRSGWPTLNPGFADAARGGARRRPDGDVELDDTAGFVVPDCDGCGGVLKPDVVFFGENVPPERVAALLRRGRRARPPTTRCSWSGSSLTVMSGLRFVRRAAQGRRTRGDRQPRRRPAATTWRR